MRSRMKTLLAGMALLVLTRSGVAAAAPLFPDVPDMWAADAVRALTAKGLIEGYPDGTFKGDRAATRYEVAMMVARLLAREEQEHTLFASKADLDDLMRLTRTLSDELNALGVRVSALEPQVATLERRVTELERITFYGSLRTIGVSQTVAGSLFAGTTANAAVDYSSGRLLFNGVGASGRMMLGTRIRLNPDMTAGLEVVAYSSTGSSAIDQYWGVTPPYNSNPFLAQTTPAVPGQQQGVDHQPFTRMSLDRFWLQDKANGYQMVLGSWQARNVGGQVLAGIRNPNANAPDLLPFWGFQFTPLDDRDPFQYEFGYAQLPTGSLYQGSLSTASSYYRFDRGSIGVSLLRLAQNSLNNGQPLTGGLLPLPRANGQQLVWRDARTGAFTAFVGPQTQNSWGANAQYDLIAKILSMRASYASSRYNPDITGAVLQTGVSGSMYNVALSAKAGQFTPEIEYLHVDPTYDTIMLPYAVNPNLPVFLPYGSWYSSHYQLHDYLAYPTNREGWRGKLRWESGPTSAFALVESLTQTKATTLTQITTPGNVEPLFPFLLTPGDASRGSTLSRAVGISHTFDNQLNLSASWYGYDMRRGGGSLDTVKFNQNFYRLALSKPLSERFDGTLSYTLIDFSGKTGLTTSSVTEGIPALTVSWMPARDTRVNLNARLFSNTDRAFGANSWHGNQLTVDVNINI